MTRSRRDRFWRRSLVARLVVYFLVLLLGAVVLVGSISFDQAKRAIERSVVGQLEVAATLKKDALVLWLEEQRLEFLLLANLQGIRSWSATMLAHPKTDPRFRDAYANANGILTPLVESKPGWQELLILSETSEVLLSTDRSHEGEYHKLEPFFVEGSKHPYVEKIHPAPDTFKPTITFSVPLGRSPAGVLAMHLDLEGIHRIVGETSGLGRESESYLVDRFHALLTDSGFGRDGFRRGVRSLGIDRALGRIDGKGRYTSYKGTPVLGVYRWIEAMDVALLIEVPQRVAFAPARRILLLVVAIGVAVAALLALGTYLLARQVAAPVLSISDAAVRVAEGDLKTRVPVVTDDEVGTLARAFNRMTETLEREISERVWAQQEREALIDELGARNAELERFTYTVSHDLKSPLVTIRGFLGMLVKDVAAGDAERVESDVEHIQRASETMRQLLDELLELSRVGRQLKAFEDVELDEVVAEALESVAGIIAQRRVEIDVQPGLGVARGDRGRLREVFQNLIDNAVAFMGDEPSPRVEIGRLDTDHDPEMLGCFVRDNGIGIEPRYHERIFDLFERLDASTEGTGVGLALVKRIVELHGGHIRIESAGRGDGTTFLFTLPAAERR